MHPTLPQLIQTLSKLKADPNPTDHPGIKRLRRFGHYLLWTYGGAVVLAALIAAIVHATESYDWNPSFHVVFSLFLTIAAALYLTCLLGEICLSAWLHYRHPHDALLLRHTLHEQHAIQLSAYGAPLLHEAKKLLQHDISQKRRRRELCLGGSASLGAIVFATVNILYTEQPLFWYLTQIYAPFREWGAAQVLITLTAFGTGLLIGGLIALARAHRQEEEIEWIDMALEKIDRMRE